MKHTKIYKGLMMLLTVVALASCTVYDNPEPYFEDYGGSLESPNQRKILLITVDGLVGEELKRDVPPNLKSIIEKSKYTYNSLSDAETNSASTWTSMMTGVRSNVHNVYDETFAAKANPNNAHAEIAFVPTFFYRLFFTRPEYNTTIISSWEPLVKKLLVEVESQILVPTDALAKDSALVQLGEKDPEVMVVNFQDVAKAGKAGGFTQDNPAYKEAIVQADKYIGEVVAAVAKRKDYDKEDWMIIITSNNGGTPEGETGGTTYAEQNTFTVLHHKSFTSQEIKPSLIGSLNFTQTASTVENLKAPLLQAEATDKYNFKDDEMSVEFKFKRNTSYGWSGQPFVLGKTARQYSHGTGIGWAIGTENNKLVLYLTFDDNKQYSYAFNTDINDYKWNHFAFTFKKSGSSLVVTLFNNGNLVSANTIAITAENNATMTTTAPLFVGVQRSHNATALSREDVNMADLRIYNTALTEKVMSDITCFVNELPATHANFANLTGSYALDYISKGIVTNQVAGATNLKLANQFVPLASKTIISTKCNADNLNNILINNVDIPTMIFYWLRIDPETSWKLSGSSVLNRFEAEFIKH